MTSKARLGIELAVTKNWIEQEGNVAQWDQRFWTHFRFDAPNDFTRYVSFNTSASD